MMPKTYIGFSQFDTAAHVCIPIDSTYKTALEEC